MWFASLTFLWSLWSFSFPLSGAQVSKIPIICLIVSLSGLHTILQYFILIIPSCPLPWLIPAPCCMHLCANVFNAFWFLSFLITDPFFFCLLFFWGLWCCIYVTFGCPPMVFDFNDLLCLSPLWRLNVSSLIPLFVIIFTNWSHRYCSAITGVFFTCLQFPVMICPILVTLTLHEWLLRLGSQCFSIEPLVHGPLSSHCLATVDPLDIRIGSLTVSLIFMYFFDSF